MGRGHEFDTIRLLMARWGDLAEDIGDDAALLPPGDGSPRVVSTDACIEAVHFRRAWLSPYEVGARAMAAALSDLAAMGARAECVLVAMVVPDAWREVLGEVADGIGSQVRAARARIVGGNLSRGDAFSITTTVIGAAPRVVRRHGAQVGDLIVVTGVLGGPGAAVGAWDAQCEPSAWARARFAGAAPRLAEGQALAAAGATAMIDISDGLAADARHLEAASGVFMDIDASRVPLGPGVAPADALVSGEEYELLATVSPIAFAALQGRWAAASPRLLTVIGVVRPSSVSGTAAPLRELPGHDHFREPASDS